MGDACATTARRPQHGAARSAVTTHEETGGSPAGRGERGGLNGAADREATRWALEPTPFHTHTHTRQRVGGEATSPFSGFARSTLHEAATREPIGPPHIEPPRCRAARRVRRCWRLWGPTAPVFAACPLRHHAVSTVDSHPSQHLPGECQRQAKRAESKRHPSPNAGDMCAANATL